MAVKEEDIIYLKKYLPSDKVEDGIRRLKNGEAIQYIIGNTNFYGNIINVNSDVLIPRFETELLVEKVVKLVKSKFKEKIDVLDIGTGSGCIAITLDKLIEANIDAVDISEKALRVARENSTLNNTNVNFFTSDVFSNVSKRYDVIISNPPYISYDEVIMDTVYNNEPHMALFADNNGLYFYDRILKECLLYLKDNFVIAFEIGYTQGNSIRKLAYKYLGNAFVSIQKDYSGRDRYVFITNK